MNRRSFFRRLVSIRLLPFLWRSSARSTEAAVKVDGSRVTRVRPSDPSWPTAESWEKLNQEVGGHLIRVEAPLAACANGLDGLSCQEALKNLQIPTTLAISPEGPKPPAGSMDGCRLQVSTQ